jgi:hypothetical protein
MIDMILDHTLEALCIGDPVPNINAFRFVPSRSPSALLPPICQHCCYRVCLGRGKHSLYRKATRFPSFGFVDRGLGRLVGESHCHVLCSFPKCMLPDLERCGSPVAWRSIFRSWRVPCAASFWLPQVVHLVAVGVVIPSVSIIVPKKLILGNAMAASSESTIMDYGVTANVYSAPPEPPQPLLYFEFVAIRYSEYALNKSMPIVESMPASIVAAGLSVSISPGISIGTTST